MFKIGPITTDVIVNRLIPYFIGAVGVILLVLFSFQMWLPAFFVLGAVVFLLFLFYFRRKPGVLIIIGMLLNYTPDGIKYGYVFLMGTFLFLFLQRLRNKRKVITFDTINLSWIGIVLFGLATVPKWNRIYMGLQWYAALAILPMVLYVVINDEYIDLQQRVWIVTDGVPIVLGFIVFETLVNLFSLIGGVDSFFDLININSFRHLEIPGNGSNRLAGVLVYLSLYIYFSRDLRNRSWIKSMTVYILVPLSLILSFLIISRGALICLVSALFLYLWGKAMLDRKVKWFPIVIALLLISLILRPFIVQLIYRMQTVKIDYSALSRLVLWRDSISKIRNSFFIGYGPGQQIFRDFSQVLEDPHNMFLRYGVDFGGVSIVFLLMILFYPFRILLTQYKRYPHNAIKSFILFAPALIGTILHSQIDSTVTSRSSGPFFWLLWAIFAYELSHANQLNDIAIKK